jgi:hypothetical protein
MGPCDDAETGGFPEAKAKGADQGRDARGLLFLISQSGWNPIAALTCAFCASWSVLVQKDGSRVASSLATIAVGLNTPSCDSAAGRVSVSITSGAKARPVGATGVGRGLVHDLPGAVDA